MRVVSELLNPEGWAASAALLLEHLDEAQQKSWAEAHTVVVCGGASGCRYEIVQQDTDTVGEVVYVFQGGTGEGFRRCIHLEGHYPGPDAVLACKLMLEDPTTEALFRAVAGSEITTRAIPAVSVAAWEEALRSGKAW